MTTVLSMEKSSEEGENIRLLRGFFNRVIKMDDLADLINGMSLQEELDYGSFKTLKGRIYGLDILIINGVDGNSTVISLE